MGEYESTDESDESIKIHRHRGIKLGPFGGLNLPGRGNRDYMDRTPVELVDDCLQQTMSEFIATLWVMAPQIINHLREGSIPSRSSDFPRMLLETARMGIFDTKIVIEVAFSEVSWRDLQKFLGFDDPDKIPDLDGMNPEERLEYLENALDEGEISQEEFNNLTQPRKKRKKR